MRTDSQLLYKRQVEDRLALRRVFYFPRRTWERLLRKYDSRDARFELLACHPVLRWTLQWPALLCGFAPESLLPGALLWGAMFVNFVLLGFFEPRNPAAITVSVPFGHIDANSVALVILVPIVFFTMRSFLQNKPFYLLLAYCRQELSKGQFDRIIAISTATFLLLWIWFFLLSAFQFVKDMSFKNTMHFLMQSVFTFLIGFSLSLWVLVSRLIVGMITRWKEVVSNDFTVDLVQEMFIEIETSTTQNMSLTNSLLDQPSLPEAGHQYQRVGDGDGTPASTSHTDEAISNPDEEAKLRAEDEGGDISERAIRLHATIANIIDFFAARLQGLVFAKALCDFTLLLFSLGNLFEKDQRSTYTAMLMISVSFVVCVICLLPAALITSAFQPLIRVVARLRPLATSHQAELDKLVTYLTPYQASGGVYLFGILINIQIVSRLIFLIYTVLITANVLA